MKNLIAFGWSVLSGLSAAAAIASAIDGERQAAVWALTCSILTGLNAFDWVKGNR